MTEWSTMILLGLVPPIAIWSLWRLQRVAVELLRRAMAKMVRHAGWAYHTVSWFGTLLHELSHAIILLPSGLGIRNFSVRSEQGHVTPRRMPMNSVTALLFILAAMAPMFMVPAIVLGMSLFLVDLPPPWGADSVQGTGESLLWLARDLVVAIGHIDVVDWRHAVFAALILLGAPGTRPSFVKGESLAGSSGDLAVVRKQFRRRPWLLAIGPAVILLGYYLVLPDWPTLFWIPLQAVAAVAVTGTVIALFGALVWWAVASNVRTSPLAAWPPWVALVGLQFLLRTLDQPTLVVNTGSFAVWAAACVMGRLVAPRRDAIDRAISK